MGDIDIKQLDLLNIFWEPGITDIQESRNLFICSLVDDDLLQQNYPQLKGKSTGKVIDVTQYVYDDTVDISDKSVVVDWYYKKTVNGKTILHFCKFVGSEVLFATENEPSELPRRLVCSRTVPCSIRCAVSRSGNTDRLWISGYNERPSDVYR